MTNVLKNILTRLILVLLLLSVSVFSACSSAGEEDGQSTADTTNTAASTDTAATADSTSDTAEADEADESADPADIAPDTSDTTAAATESTEAANGDNDQITVKLTVNCLNAVSGKVPGAEAFAPDGEILAETTFRLAGGSTVYDALKESGLIINASNIAGSLYVESIQGIRQGAAGGGAGGWIYSVNGKFPPVSSSRFDINDGDEIVFHYTVKTGDVPGSPY